MCSNITIKHLLTDCILHEKERKLLTEKIEKKCEFNLQNLLGEEAPVRDIMEFLTRVKCIKNISEHNKEEVLMATAARTPNSTEVSNNKGPGKAT